MAATQNQIDNLVNLLDGYVTKGGHHLNVNVFSTGIAFHHKSKEFLQFYQNACYYELYDT